MIPAERVAAMRRGQLTREQLAAWTGRCPDQVPRSDEISPVLTERGGSRYESPPQEHVQALALVRALFELPELPRGCRPWQRTRPGGTRTIDLQRAGQ